MKSKLFTICLCRGQKQFRYSSNGGIFALVCTKKGVDATPLRGFSKFFLDDQTSAPDVFSSCSFILCMRFEARVLMISYYG